MTDKMPVNPLLQGLASRAMPEPCSVVIFGATGDLTHRKLVPALYNLAVDGDLPPGLSLVGFARRDKTDAIFRTELEEAARKYSRQTINDELWKNFANTIYYHRSEFGENEGYDRLRERLNQLDKDRGTRGNRLFYLSAGPDQFENILTNLRSSGLADAPAGSWSRVIVWNRSVDRQAPQQHGAQMLPRGVHLPDRPFSGEGNGTEYHGLAFR
jgi:glucose-6-phosphate 1-dehydrogenase